MTTSSGALRGKAAAEIRAEMGRKHLSQSALAKRLDRGQPWVSRRIGEHADTPITLDDLEEFASALNVSATQLLGWDANLKHTRGYQGGSRLVGRLPALIAA